MHVLNMNKIYSCRHCVCPGLHPKESFLAHDLRNKRVWTIDLSFNFSMNVLSFSPAKKIPRLEGQQQWRRCAR